MNLTIIVLYTAKGGQPGAELKKNYRSPIPNKLYHPPYLQDDPSESIFRNVFYILQHTKYNTWLMTSLNYTAILYFPNSQYYYTRIFEIKRGV